ncbi:MAG TPA: DUF1684 domain-containing protein [Pedobacter sp.]|nr:DUF1684 domain-containing protein [Pedobacter sp.]
MKYLLIAFLLISSSVFAQNYKTIINQHREAYKEDFIKETRSPLKESDFKDLHFFDPDSTYNIIASVELLTDQKVFNMPTYDGTSKEFIRYANVKFKLGNKSLQLTLYKSVALAVNPLYRNLLFLPFTDKTNQKLTYAGGRYIDLSLLDIKNQQIAIDFNKAYNPYCAYSDGYRCPIPPEENDLPIEILAGEKKFTGEKKHK